MYINTELLSRLGILNHCGPTGKGAPRSVHVVGGKAWRTLRLDTVGLQLMVDTIRAGRHIPDFGVVNVHMDMAM